jgi:predicted porin
LTFGDKSWGSIKLGKDLGIYASEAILNDMTLLGVGSGAGSLAGNTTTLGRIGSGFMYADWKSQVAYSSPNWNGFSFTVGLTQAWNAQGDTYSTRRAEGQTAYEGKASYEWTGDVAGKVWASAISQKVEGLSNAVGAGPNTVTSTSDRANAWDVGTTVNVAGFGLTGYYGQGKGIGQTLQLLDGFDANGKRRDSDQWYLQATYALPGVGTKLGVSYGESTLDGNSVDTFDEVEDSMWTVGAYHPLTKHLNLVAEYSQSERQVDLAVGGDAEAKAKTISLGAILFF